MRRLRNALPDGGALPGRRQAALDTDRCIGCGLCVTTCPTGSLSLVRKPEARQPYVPKDIVDNYIRWGEPGARWASGS